MFIYYLSFIIYYLFFIMNLKMENLKMGTEMEMLEISKKDIRIDMRSMTFPCRRVSISVELTFGRCSRVFARLRRLRRAKKYGVPKSTLLYLTLLTFSVWIHSLDTLFQFPFFFV